MRTLIILSLVVCIGLLSCKKESTADLGINVSNSKTGSPSGADMLPTSKVDERLAGNWHVVSDTSHSIWEPSGYENIHIYVGTDADHYNFSASGLFDIEEDNLSRSGTYSLTDKTVSLNQLGLPSWAHAPNYEVLELTDHSAVLKTVVNTPAGPGWNILTLTK